MHMQYNNLTSLITALEYGTNLHISVLFLNRYGNRKLLRLESQTLHQCPVCNSAKEKDFAACFRCRNTVLKMLIRHKRSFAGYCTKGVYEYCRPVVRKDTVIAVIFIGNILTDSPEQKKRLYTHVQASMLQTMESNFTQDDCHRIADLLESYIQYLLDRYGETTQDSSNVLIQNIKNYIDENLLHDFSMEDLASIFNYNEKYLGRMFKHKTGITIKEYCNVAKVEKAKDLLTSTSMNIANIAAYVGYNNVTYFNRVFKKATGQSPLEYRNEASKN